MIFNPMINLKRFYYNGKKREEIKREVKDNEKNIEILSKWKNWKNYDIEVKKLYAYVYLKFVVYHIKKDHFLKKNLDYIIQILKKELKEVITTYYPKG